MKIVFDNRKEAYERLDTSSDPGALQMIHMVQDMNEDQVRGNKGNSGVTYRARTNVGAPSALLPYPATYGNLGFFRNGDLFFGMVQLVLDGKYSMKHFSRDLRKDLSARYEWDDFRPNGTGHVNLRSASSEFNPIIAVDGGKIKRGPHIRQIWIGASGSSTRRWDDNSPSAFDQAFDQLQEIADIYVNSYLNYCARNRCLLDVLRGKKVVNPSQSVVRLSSF